VRGKEGKNARTKTTPIINWSILFSCIESHSLSLSHSLTPYVNGLRVEKYMDFKKVTAIMQLNIIGRLIKIKWF
jgi:hypothetical protein